MGKEARVSIIGAVGQQHAQMGIEFVYSAIGIKTAAAFAHSLASHKGCHASVTCLSVYCHSVLWSNFDE